MSSNRKQPQSRYVAPSALDQRVRELDGAVATWLAKLEAYLATRWPRLGRWLAG